MSKKRLPKSQDEELENLPTEEDVEPSPLLQNESNILMYTTLKALAPKLFRGVPKDAVITNSVRLSDRVEVTWRYDGKDHVRSEQLKNLPKGSIVPSAASSSKGKLK